MSKTGPSRGTNGKGDHRREGTDLKQKLKWQSVWPSPVYALIIAHLFGFVKGFFGKSLGFLKNFSERERGQMNFDLFSYFW